MSIRSNDSNLTESQPQDNWLRIQVWGMYSGKMTNFFVYFHPNNSHHSLDLIMENGRPHWGTSRVTKTSNSTFLTFSSQSEISESVYTHLN